MSASMGSPRAASLPNSSSWPEAWRRRGRRLPGSRWRGKRQAVRIHVTAPSSAAGQLTTRLHRDRSLRPWVRSIWSVRRQRRLVKAILASCDPTILVNAGLNERSISCFRRLICQPSASGHHEPYFPTAHLVYNVVLSALGHSIQCAPWRRPGSARALSPSATARHAAASRPCSTNYSTPRWRHQCVTMGPRW